MARNYPYHEEIKIMMSEVYRTGDMTDAEWTYKYERLKEKTPLEQMGNFIDAQMALGYSLEESRNVVKRMLVESKKRNEITT